MPEEHQEESHNSNTPAAEKHFAVYPPSNDFYRDEVRLTKSSKSQFEVALDQKEQLVRQEYEIVNLHKQLERIEADTVRKVNFEWESRTSKIQNEVAAQTNSKSFWSGFILCFVIFLFLFIIGLLRF